VDRLSRSLLDFAKMMETFEQHGVSFVSITQQFNWASVRVVCASGTAYAV
jgi:site-specific DNA recombinase